MKHRVFKAASLVLIGLLAASAAVADEDLRADSKQAVNEFLKADTSLQRFFSESAAYAIFPNVGKGGLIVGGAHGKGLVFVGTNLIGRVTMTQATVGAQVGGETYAEIIFFDTPAALEDFKSGKFEMSAEISAVAAAEGASKTAKYTQGVAVFTLPKKGLMAQATVGGQKFKFEPEPLEPTGR